MPFDKDAAFARNAARFTLAAAAAKATEALAVLNGTGRAAGRSGHDAPPASIFAAGSRSQSSSGWPEAAQN